LKQLIFGKKKEPPQNPPASGTPPTDPQG